jgi:hypothetical protein
MRPFEYQVLTEEELDYLERTPFNPPILSESFDEDEFSNECNHTFDLLKKRLDLFGDEWSVETDEGDYILPDGFGRDRWIYITFRSTRLWRPELVAAVVDLLQHLPNEFCVCFLTELNDVEISNEPLVFLAITPTRVAGQGCDSRLDEAKNVITTPRNDVLERFGFPRSLLG